MAVGRRQAPPPKVLLNDSICVVAPGGTPALESNSAAVLVSCSGSSSVTVSTIASGSAFGSVSAFASCSALGSFPVSTSVHALNAAPVGSSAPSPTGEGSSPESVLLAPVDALSVCSAISGSARSFSVALARAGALRMHLQNSVSQEFFCSSIAETDAQSVGGGSEARLESFEHPPSIESLREATCLRFSAKWLKYMYAKFKNECPSGRMRVHEFKRLLSAYVPDRISDAYLERMFFAMCGGAPSGYVDQLTFRDLIVSLAALLDDDPRQSAEWMMRLINAPHLRSAAGTTRISSEDFIEFVKSVFLLAGRTLSIAAAADNIGHQPRDSSARSFNSALAVQSTRQRLLPPAVSMAGIAASPSTGSVVVVRRATLTAIRRRAIVAFKELDSENRGYLTVDDFERWFRLKGIPI